MSNPNPEADERVRQSTKARLKTTPVVMVPHDKWIALTLALETSPDISVADLITKAERITTARKNYARQVIELEGKLLKKCPDLDQ